MQIRAFSKRSYKTTETCFYLKFTGFVTHPLKLLLIYILSRSMLSFYSFYPRTEVNVSYFVDTVNFTIFQKAVTSKAYKISACKGALLKEQLFLFVILILIFWPAKSERARAKLVSAILQVFPFFAVLIIGRHDSNNFRQNLCVDFDDYSFLYTFRLPIIEKSVLYTFKKIDLLLFAAARGNLNLVNVLFSLQVTQVK